MALVVSIYSEDTKLDEERDHSKHLPKECVRQEIPGTSHRMLFVKPGYGFDILGLGIDRVDQDVELPAEGRSREKVYGKGCHKADHRENSYGAENNLPAIIHDPTQKLLI